MRQINPEVKIAEMLSMLEYILFMPIPNRNCIDPGDQLTANITDLMIKFASDIMRRLHEVDILISNSMLGTVLNKYMRCSYLIIGNQLFLKDQIMDIELRKYMIERQVGRTRRNFY